MSVAGAESTLDQVLKKFGRAGTADRFRLVCLVSLDGNVLACSPATLERAGLTAEESIGRPIWMTVWWEASPASGAEVREAVLRAAQGEFVRCDVRAQIAKNGTETVLLDLTASPVRNEDGAVTALLIEA